MSRLFPTFKSCSHNLFKHTCNNIYIYIYIYIYIKRCKLHFKYLYLYLNLRFLFHHIITSKQLTDRMNNCIIHIDSLPITISSILNHNAGMENIHIVVC